MRARRRTLAGWTRRAGLYDQAIAASPDSPFLYREVADVARRQGDLDTALAQAQKALELEPTDVRAQILLGDIYDAQKDAAKAVAAYEAALALEPNEALERKVESLREGLALAAMPTEFQAIESSTTLSREQLAALVGVRLDGLFKRAPRRNAVVITDTRGSWAIPWIMSVTRVGVMEVYPNHTFQPGGHRAPRRSGGGGEPRALAHRGREAGARLVVAEREAAVRRRAAGAPELSRRVRGGRGRRDAAARRRELSAVAARDRRRSGRRRQEARGSRRKRQAMNLTAANQLTILRMLIIPAFVILLLYGYRGWALVSFFVAGITDLLDGLIARRAGQKTTLGAWLDPMADKLLLVTHVRHAHAAGHRLGEPAAALVHGARHQP